MEPHVPQTGLSDRQLDVRYYAGLFWRGKQILLAGCAVAAALAALLAFLQTPEYSASTMLLIDPPTPTFLTVTDALVGGSNYWQNADFYNTQFRVLRASSLGEKVVDHLKLREQAAFKGIADPGRLFMSHIAVAPIPETRLVVVSLRHPDPKEATRWVNALAEIYVKETLATRVDAALNASQWIQERLTATQQNMRESREKFLKALEGQDLFVPEGGVSVLSTLIVKLNEDYIQAQARRIGLEAAVKQAADMRARRQTLDALPQVASDGPAAALDAQLGALNIEMTRLRDKYKPAHPEVLRLTTQIEQNRKAKDARAEQILEAMRAELRQIQKRESELRVAIDQQKAVAAGQSRKSSEIEALRRESESAKSLYDVLLQKLNETDIAASIRNNNVSIIERAIEPKTPVHPRKTRMITIGAVIGLLLGVGLVLGRDYLENTIKDPEEIERYLHLDLLAAVPSFSQGNGQLVTEAYQSLRTALIFARQEDTGQVVLVTGTAPQEGKTTTIVNLAQLLAASGDKTLVLDFDLRRAQIHTRFGLPREPGLSSYFAKQGALESLVRATRVPNLFAITAGPLPPNPPAILSRKNIGEFLAHFRQQFQWILLDSPPLASVTDALLLARYADLALFVVQHNKVDKHLIKRHVASLRKATPNLLGAVLNDVDLKVRGYYYYYYPQRGKRQGDRAANAQPSDHE